jgi:hypothetical protein
MRSALPRHGTDIRAFFSGFMFRVLRSSFLSRDRLVTGFPTEACKARNYLYRGLEYNAALGVMAGFAGRFRSTCQ